jgi:CPA1 family monovalent cation:H+ antiporter
MQLPLILSVIRGNYSWSSLLTYGAIFSLFLIGLRLIWVYPAAWLTHQIRNRLLGQNSPVPNPRQVFVIGWTGMRGVIALAAAISLPETLADGRPFATRSLILFLAFSIILVTLVIQGLTLPPLIRALGLSTPHGTNDEECEARRLALTSAIDFLQQSRDKEGSDRFTHIYDDLLHRYSHRLAAVGGSSADADEHRLDAATYQRLRAIAAGAVQAERHTMITLRNQGRLSDESLRSMERELDLLESRYASSHD